MSAPGAARRPVRAVVFDLDGTLVDSLSFCVSAIVQACREVTGRSIPESEVRSRFGPSESGVIRALVGAPDHKAAYRRFWEIYRADHRRRVSVFEGIPPLLHGLKVRGIRSAVVTGKGEETARWTLEATGLGVGAGTVWAGSMDGGLKRENLARAAAHLAVAPREAAYVGDQPSDMTIAREAGVRAVGAGWAPGSDRAALALHGAEVVLRSPRELLRWIDGQSRSGERGLPDPPMTGRSGDPGSGGQG
ncbi:MAG: HAD family hydrolase [Thermoplasmata archaeon]